jgi:S1-C subfamily serine protease
MVKGNLLLVALVAALAGAGPGAGVVLLAGHEGSATRTVVQQAPLATRGGHRSQGTVAAGLTPRDIYRRTAPGVVFIRAQVAQQAADSPFFPQEAPGESTGSGFVLDRAGTILTNAHVIAGAEKVTVQLGGKRVVAADVVGRDSSSDLALLKVEPRGLGLRPLPLGESRAVQVGDPTIAIGNPFGLDRTLTTGVVSALQRRIRAPNNFEINHVIQTDAAINPGNSGGPLLDATGRVIGVNSQIETGGESRQSAGIAFAVPIDTAKRVIPQLRDRGRVDRPYLGLTSRTIDPALRGLDLPARSGALVQVVAPGSPAAVAGIIGGDIPTETPDGSVRIGGDVIRSVDGKPVLAADDVGEALAGHRPGDEVAVIVLRVRGRRTLHVRLGQRPDVDTTLAGAQLP